MKDIFFQKSLQRIYLSSDKTRIAGLPRESNEVGIWSVSPFGTSQLEAEHFTLPHPTAVESIAWSPVKCKWQSSN